jgi:hypothetical protein
MVQTRSGEGQDIPLVIRAHIANRRNQAPPSPPPPLNQMDPALQQFFVAQTQLLHVRNRMLVSLRGGGVN